MPVETPCANTVAMAALVTPQPNTRTKTESSNTLTIEETTIAINGVLLSPSARNRAENVL